MDSAPRPYFVCTDCRHICDSGQCDRCGLGSSTVQVHDAEDLRLAKVAML